MSRPTLQTDRALVAIRTDILRCMWQPGARITETMMAEQYGFGRAAVRTALNRLQQEQLVHAVARQGYLVAPVTIQQVEELFAIRLLLEPAAAGLAAERAGTKEVEHLRRLHDKMHSLSDEQFDTHDYWRLNTSFHVAVAQASQNATLAEILCQLLAKMERFFNLGVFIASDRHQRQADAGHVRQEDGHQIHGHGDLVEVIASKDASRASLLAEDGVNRAKDLVLEALMRNPSLKEANISRALTDTKIA